MIPLQIKIIEEQIRRLERDLNKLQGISLVVVPDELTNSAYLIHAPINHGPEYLTVLASSWDHNMVTEFGVVHELHEARELAYNHGLKGITLQFGEHKVNERTNPEAHACQQLLRPQETEVPSFGDSEA